VVVRVSGIVRELIAAHRGSVIITRRPLDSAQLEVVLPRGAERSASAKEAGANMDV
jgi:hypothetical protein